VLKQKPIGELVSGLSKGATEVAGDWVTKVVVGLVGISWAGVGKLVQVIRPSFEVRVLCKCFPRVVEVRCG
jgi:hypothetical protein